MSELVAAARERLAEAFDAGTRVALEFGGGKDSHACLYLCRPWWDRLIVLWGNPGDPFPETVELMERMRGLVGTFHEVRGNSREEAARAYPVDLLPIRATPLGRWLQPEGSRVTLRSRSDCCGSNLWLPMARAKAALGIEVVIRGQRESEYLRSPLRDRATRAGAPALCLPIETWSEADVYAYLAAEGVALPRSYDFVATSMDCMRCTGYMEEARGRMAYLRKFHPEVAREYRDRLALITAEQAHAIEHVRTNIEEIQWDS